MNYETFRRVWHEALDLADLRPFFRPSETVNLQEMSRMYHLSVVLGVQRADPFTVTAGLEWRWDALQAARTTTTEEDLLIELLGRDGYYLVTERPWLRVDVTLRGVLPLDSPMPMPGARVWRRWATEVTARLEPILPNAGEEDERGIIALSWRGEPVARVRCDPGGRLVLTRVELSAWQGIELTRQWDNPDRELDYGTEAQLAGFAQRLRQAMEEWEDSLEFLQVEGSGT